MPLTALEPLDSSWQPARFVVLHNRRLQANRVDHRSLAGCSLHNLGSGQQVAAGARRRGGAARIRSAIKFSCSGGATMYGAVKAVHGGWRDKTQVGTGEAMCGGRGRGTLNYESKLTRYTVHAAHKIKINNKESAEPIITEDQSYIRRAGFLWPSSRHAAPWVWTGRDDERTRA